MNYKSNSDNQLYEKKIEELERRIQYLEAENKKLTAKTANTNNQETTTVSANSQTAETVDIDGQKQAIKSNIIETTDENFDEKVLKNKKTVITDFWATWCAPCKQLFPILEEISNEMSEVVFAKHNIDEQPNMPVKYGVRGIPTMLIFKNGELKGTKVGATTKSNIVSWIKENL